MSAASELLGDRVWTPADLHAIVTDETWRRYEIVDGLLVVSPPPSPLHESFVVSVGAVLQRLVPTGYEVTAAIGITLGRSYRITDLTVVSTEFVDANAGQTSGEGVLLAVEIESPSSITTDRITKPAQYAQAGIPFFWRIERDPSRLITYRLVDGVYQQTGSWGRGDTASLGEPFRAEVTMTEMFRR